MPLPLHAWLLLLCCCCVTIAAAASFPVATAAAVYWLTMHCMYVAIVNHTIWFPLLYFQAHHLLF